MKPRKSKLLLCICGPTASGKTALSLSLAEKYHCSILNADSRQFYREMNIGTAKVGEDEGKGIVHYFINNLSICEDYNVFTYEKEAIARLDEIFKRDSTAIVVGGSGLYLHAIWEGIDKDLPGPDLSLRKQMKQEFEENGIEALRNRLQRLDEDRYEEIDKNNPVRLMRAIEICEQSEKTTSRIRSSRAVERPFDILKIAIDTERAELHKRIEARVGEMMDKGLVEEVRSLLPYREKNALQTVGYRELFQYFDGELSLEEAREKIVVNTRRYAKRQLTWLRRYKDIHWFKTGEEDKIINLIEKHS